MLLRAPTLGGIAVKLADDLVTVGDRRPSRCVPFGPAQAAAK